MYNIDDSITDEDLTQIPKQALKAELKLMALDLNTPYSTIHEDNEIENLRRQARVLNKLFFKLLSIAQEDSAYISLALRVQKQYRQAAQAADRLCARGVQEWNTLGRSNIPPEELAAFYGKSNQYSVKEQAEKKEKKEREEKKRREEKERGANYTNSLNKKKSKRKHSKTNYINRKKTEKVSTLIEHYKDKLTLDKLSKPVFNPDFIGARCETAMPLPEV